MSIKAIYLILYNSFQFLGWLYFFIKVLKGLIISKTCEEIYNETHFILEYCQYGAILEIIHSFLKIVKSSILATSIQILGRCAIVAILQHLKNSVSIGYLLLSFAWSSIEIVRYPYYLFNSIKNAKNKFEIPYILIWCRYSFFIVLYPIGVSGEMITIWNARKDLEKYNLGNRFTFASLVYPIYILYIPSLIFLYYYLFKQRNKSLSKLNLEKIVKKE